MDNFHLGRGLNPLDLERRDPKIKFFLSCRVGEGCYRLFFVENFPVYLG